eukprot:SAG22_NODE_7871_length_701_cov_0.958472_1_plen_185_part_01
MLCLLDVRHLQYCNCRQMTYVERVFQYIDLPGEPAAVLPSDPAGWPNAGSIEVQNISLRYRPGLPLALDGVSLSVAPRERVGICGRTGSGKSTLTLALFRVVELASGAIRIDGRDIAGMGLQALRRGLTIIPQDPVMFTGTLRDNLDPFGERDDAALQQALRTVRLDRWVQCQEGDTLAAASGAG